MTKRAWKAAIFGAGVVVVLVLGFVSWYRAHYSMEPARTFEVAGAGSAPDVLVATQGSAFKDAVVADLVDHLKRREARVSVIDVSSLSRVNADEWNAIVVIHTWEMRKPPAPVKSFIEGLDDKSKLVVLTTSGSGDFKMDGVDAISAASRVEDASARAAELSAKIDAVLGSGSAADGPSKL